MSIHIDKTTLEMFQHEVNLVLGQLGVTGNNPQERGRETVSVCVWCVCVCIVCVCMSVCMSVCV